MYFFVIPVLTEFRSTAGEGERGREGGKRKRGGWGREVSLRFSAALTRLLSTSDVSPRPGEEERAGSAKEASGLAATGTSISPMLDRRAEVAAGCKEEEEEGFPPNTASKSGLLPPPRISVKRSTSW